MRRVFVFSNRVLPNSSSYGATASAERATDDRDGHTDNHAGKAEARAGMGARASEAGAARHIAPMRGCGGRRLGHRKTARTLTRTRETTGPAWNGMAMAHVGRGEHDTSNTHHSRKYIAGGAQRNMHHARISATRASRAALAACDGRASSLAYPRCDGYFARRAPQRIRARADKRAR